MELCKVKHWTANQVSILQLKSGNHVKFLLWFSLFDPLPLCFIKLYLADFDFFPQWKVVNSSESLWVISIFIIIERYIVHGILVKIIVIRIDLHHWCSAVHFCKVEYHEIKDHRYTSHNLVIKRRKVECEIMVRTPIGHLLSIQVRYGLEKFYIQIGRLLWR